MEKALFLNAEVREQTGSKSAAKLRKLGWIPAIVYGHKKEPVAISLQGRGIVEGLHHGHRLIDVQIGKKKQKMLVKDVQYDHLGKDIIHIDLMRVEVTETVKVTVPIELKGEARGMQDGGIIAEHTDHLEIECQAGDIPETFVVSVKDMDVGDAIYASDVELGSGVKLISPPETLLATCSLVAAAKAVEEVEEAAAVGPEVIGEVEKAEEEASEGQAKSDKGK